MTNQDRHHQQGPEQQIGQSSQDDTDSEGLASKGLYRKPWRAGSKLGEPPGGNPAEQGIVHADPSKLKLLLG